MNARGGSIDSLEFLHFEDIVGPFTDGLLVNRLARLCT